MALEYGWELGEYDNFYNGGREQGFNPRELEVMYLKRSKKSWRKYPKVPLPDLVHKRHYPASNSGYARIFANQSEEKLTDNILSHLEYQYTKDKYPFENKWLRFKRKFKSNKKFTKELIKIMHSHGPMLSQIEYGKFLRFLPAVHGVVLVGYGNPIESPEETVFIIHDSYGDHPKDYGVRVEGGPSYKYIKAKYLESVIVFPHKPLIKAAKKENGIELKAFNKAKKELKIQGVSVWNHQTKTANPISPLSSGEFVISKEISKLANSGYIDIYITTEFYNSAPDKGYWFKLKAF